MLLLQMEQRRGPFHQETVAVDDTLALCTVVEDSLADQGVQGVGWSDRAVFQALAESRRGGSPSLRRRQSFSTWTSLLFLCTLTRNTSYASAPQRHHSRVGQPEQEALPTKLST